MNPIEIQLPYNLESEERVLGSMICNAEALSIGFEKLKREAFYFRHTIALYDLLKTMISKDFIISVQAIVEQAEIECLTGVLTSKDIFRINILGVENYLQEMEVLLELDMSRKGIEQCKKTMENLYAQEKKPFEIFSETTNSLFNLISDDAIVTQTPGDIIKSFGDGKSFKEYRAMLKQRIAKGEKPYDGLCTGYSRIDDAICGLKKGQLYYCGARTSVGKTTFMLNIINNIVTRGKEKVAFMSLEMSAHTIMAKLIGINAQVHYNQLMQVQTNEYQEKCIEVSEDLYENQRNANLFIEAPARISIEKLAIRAERLKKFHNIDVLFIDHMSCINLENGSGKEDHEQVGEISKRLQQLARRLNIPIFCLAQLNRASANRFNGIPELTDFQGSDRLAQDADVVFFLWRWDYFHDGQNPKNEKPDPEGTIRCYIKKNREFSTVGRIDFRCNKIISDRYFEEVSENDKEQSRYIG